MALPAHSGSGVGRLVVHAKASWLAWSFRALGSVQMTVNGGQVPAQWGTNVVDLPEGQHNVDVSVKYLVGSLGHALTVVPVQAGQQTELYYKAPVLIYKAGALDTSPKGYPGMALALTLSIVAVALVVALVLAGVLLR